MPRKLNNSSRKEDILKLRSEGKTYSEIADKLKCSKSVISYHCGSGKEKERVKSQVKNRSPIERKISAFRARVTRPVGALHNKEKLRAKVKTFKRADSRGNTHGLVNNITLNYTYKDVLDKIGENPICYLTGEPIDLDKPSTYHLDHIIPVSRGGTNDIANLGICLKDANFAKGNLSVGELKKLCRKILNHLT